MEMRLTIIYEQSGDLVQASVAELPGAISLGKTREEARANLAEAIEMVLEGNRLLAGDAAYEVTKGEVLYEGRNLLELAPDERAREGVFLAFQYPVEVPGVSNAQFLRLAYNEKRKHRGEEELDPLEFKDLLTERAKIVEMDAGLMSRSVNEGFSGGEKKRNEILQMAVLEPKLAVLDETDSGLDIDALRIVADGVNKLRTPDNAIILVTHYQRLLNYIVPDRVHVLYRGRIVRSGGKELALALEEKGYDWIKEAVSDQQSAISA